jgi:hypothetical protein
MAFSYKEARLFGVAEVVLNIKKADIYVGFKNPRPAYIEARDLKKRLRRRL